MEISKGAVMHNFITGRNPDGISWPPRKDNKPHPLLILSGDLLASAVQAGAKNHFEQVADTEFKFGTDIVYGPVHNFGGRRMPQREFMGIGNSTIDDCGDILADFIAGAIV